MKLLSYSRKGEVSFGIGKSNGLIDLGERLKNIKMLLNEIETPTPFAFPLLVERLKNTLSNEPIEKRVEKLINIYSD